MTMGPEVTSRQSMTLGAGRRQSENTYNHLGDQGQEQMDKRMLRSYRHVRNGAFCMGGAMQSPRRRDRKSRVAGCKDVGLTKDAEITDNVGDMTCLWVDISRRIEYQTRSWPKWIAGCRDMTRSLLLEDRLEHNESVSIGNCRRRAFDAGVMVEGRCGVEGGCRRDKELSCF